MYLFIDASFGSERDVYDSELFLQWYHLCAVSFSLFLHHNIS